MAHPSPQGHHSDPPRGSIALRQRRHQRSAHGAAAEPMPSGNGWRAGESIPSETGSVVELLDLFMCHKMELFLLYIYILMLVLFLRKRHLRMSLQKDAEQVQISLII